MPTIPYDPSGEALLHPGRRPTLFDAEKSYSLEQLGAECARLAYIDAQNDPDECKRLAEALDRVGFGKLELFRDDVSGTGTEGFGAVHRSDGRVVLAFRGTEAGKLADLFTDLSFLPTGWPEGAGQVHCGFAHGLRSVLSAVRAWLDKVRGEQALLLCGHSLGAALATLAASVFRGADLVTLGSPRVGDGEFARSLHAVSSVRFVNCCDAVTHLPLQTPWSTHVEARVYIDAGGQVHRQAADDFIWDDQFNARLPFALKHALRVGSAGARDFADHAPINYLRALFY
jgi:hypothetical protein